jgi:hypothetical protein
VTGGYRNAIGNAMTEREWCEDWKLRVLLRDLPQMAGRAPLALRQTRSMLLQTVRSVAACSDCGACKEFRKPSQLCFNQKEKEMGTISR